MSDKEITFKVTLKLDEKWAGNLSREELIEYLKARLSSSMGFRGEVKTLVVL